MNFLPRLLHPARRWQVLGLVSCGLGQVAISAAAAWLAKWAFDTLFTGRQALALPALAGIASAYITLAGLIMVLRVGERRLAERLGQGYVASLRVRLFRHLLNTQPRVRQTRRRGHLMLRFLGDLNAVRQWVSLGVSRLVVLMVSAPGALIALLWLNASLAATAALAFVIIGLAIVISSRPLSACHRQARRRRSQIAGNLGEKLTEASVIQAYGRKEPELKRLRRQNRRLVAAMVHRAQALALIRCIPEAGSALTAGALLLVGAMEVAAGAASPGDVIAALMLLGMLIAPLRDLARVFDYHQGFRVAREKLASFFSLEPLRPMEQVVPALKSGPGHLQFEDLSIADSLTGIDAEVKPGATIALAGASGAGKSTLLMAASGLLRPDQGRVWLDGQDLDACDPDSFHRVIGFAAADLPLLRGTIESNLRLRCPQATDEELARVIAYCELEAALHQLPQGLKTPITEGGRNLSAGIRQRLCLARALIGSPSLLLLDDIDAESDARAGRVLDRILACHPGTVLLATHHRARLERVDLIWHLEDGRLRNVCVPEKRMGRDGLAA